MSGKEERFVILEDDVQSRFLIAEVMGNGLLLTDTRNPGVTRAEICAQPDKNYDGKLLKRDIPLGEIQEFNVQQSFNCSLCQNLCINCKSICVTCKTPCKKCSLQQCQDSSTDTDDFDRYLESQTKKIKPAVKVKTTGTDTCDLEGHFDYYKSEKKVVKILKHVATDCFDLNLRNIVIKKPVKNSVAVDTSDLHLISTEKDLNNDSDSEFSWPNKEGNKTYIIKDNVEISLRNNGKNCDDNIIIVNSLGVNDVSAYLPPVKSAVKQDIGNSTKILNFDDSSSDDSDIDLATSCKVSKCRKLARKNQITLKQLIKGKETSFECSICGDTFFKKYEGILHLGNHIDRSSFKCLSCKEKFASVDLLFSHVKDKHDHIFEMKSKTENKENSRVDLSKPKINKIYHCTHCPEDGEKIQFDSYKSLNHHKKEIHGIDCTNESEGEKVRRKSRIPREYICLICGKQFKSSKSLKDHSAVHTGEKNYQCDICKKSYTTSSNLKIHIRTHTGAKNFVCSVCEKAFHKKDSLKVHFRKHSGEKPFQCDLCPMRFDRNYILKNHRYTHSPDKKFICPVCGKTFRTHGSLNNHEKGHKKDPLAKKPRKPAVKPTLEAANAVMCDVCGKVYSTRSNLRIHKFVHLGVKPFECTICHQTYAKKDSMLTHMRKHTDERPFACGTCGMTFYRNHTLKTHLLRHTGERPHKCKMCNRSFAQSSSLKYHLKNHGKKVERKRVTDDTTRVKKKRLSQGTKSGKGKKVQKPGKPFADLFTEDAKPLLGVKKPVEAATNIVGLKNSISASAPQKEIGKGMHFMIPEKEILILDKNVGVEIPRNLTGKEPDFYSLDKEIVYGNQCNTGKFNYYIAKSHVFTVPNDAVKVKEEPEIPVEKNEEEEEDADENLIISKDSYITKEGNLVTINRDSSLKDVKEFMQIEDERLGLKPQTTIPITGEILNAAFISDENGDVIPLSSMTLQGLTGENVMISPLISVEGDEKKEFFRNPRITYNFAPTSRTTNEKSQPKGNYHIINLKDSRVPQKIQIELDAPTIHIQSPVDDGTLHGMSTFYTTVQQNEI